MTRGKRARRLDDNRWQAYCWSLCSIMHRTGDQSWGLLEGKTGGTSMGGTGGVSLRGGEGGRVNGGKSREEIGTATKAKRRRAIEVIPSGPELKRPQHNCPCAVNDKGREAVWVLEATVELAWAVRWIEEGFLSWKLPDTLQHVHHSPKKLSVWPVPLACPPPRSPPRLLAGPVQAGEVAGTYTSSGYLRTIPLVG